MESSNTRRCLLAQAAIYIEHGRTPIADEVYLSAPDADVGPPTQLIRALRAGSIIAVGALHDLYRTYRSFKKPPDWLLFSTVPLVAIVKIDARWWTMEQVDIRQSRLFANEDVVRSIYNIDSIDREYAVDADHDKSEFAFAFTNVTVGVDELFRVFPRDKTGSPTSRPALPQASSRVGRGRPRKHPWDEMYIEIIARAQLGRLPETQAELVSQMAQWWVDMFREQPADSLLRERISAIYERLRKATVSEP
jgi:hypothetical protein